MYNKRHREREREGMMRERESTGYRQRCRRISETRMYNKRQRERGREGMMRKRERVQDTDKDVGG